MSDGNRALNEGMGVLAAILICSLVVGFLAFSVGRKAGEGERIVVEYDEAAKREAVLACSAKPPALMSECLLDKVAAGREQARGEQDLSAQKQMAFWAALMTLITLGTTLISWRALQYLRDTFKETARTAEEARNANEIARSQIRAHLVCEGGSFRIGPTYAVYKLFIKNIGITPAFSCRTRAQLYLPRKGKDLGSSDHFGRELGSVDLIPAGLSGNAFADFSSVQTRFGALASPQILVAQHLIDAIRDPEFPWHTLDVTMGWTDIFGRRQMISFTLSEDREETSKEDDGVRTGKLIVASTWGYADNVPLPAPYLRRVESTPA